MNKRERKAARKMIQRPYVVDFWRRADFFLYLERMACDRRVIQYYGVRGFLNFYRESAKNARYCQTKMQRIP